MNRSARTFLILAAISAAGIGGFFVGRPGGSGVANVASTATAPTGAVVYYRDPDGKPQYSAQPVKTADGRPYRAVFASEDISFDPTAKTAATSATDRKRVLYYRNPMGLPDVSPTPKKDSMGMDYIPVFADKGDASTVKVSLDRVQRSGVRSEPARMQNLSRPVRASGVAKPDVLITGIPKPKVVAAGVAEPDIMITRCG